MDEFSDESEEGANNDMEDNPPVRHGDGLWSQSKLFVSILNLLAVMDQRNSLVLMLNPLTSLIFSSQNNSGL